MRRAEDADGDLAAVGDQQLANHCAGGCPRAAPRRSGDRCRAPGPPRHRCGRPRSPGPPHRGRGGPGAAAPVAGPVLGAARGHYLAGAVIRKLLVANRSEIADPGLPRGARARASAPSPSTPTKTASPCTGSRPTRRTRSASRATRSAPTSTSPASCDARCDAAPTPSTPATASSPRTPTSPRPARTPGSSSSARSPTCWSRLGDKVRGPAAARRPGCPCCASRGAVTVAGRRAGSGARRSASR